MAAPQMSRRALLGSAFGAVAGGSVLLALINRELGTQGDYKGGLGLYRSFVHMDIGKRSRWNG